MDGIALQSFFISKRGVISIPLPHKDLNACQNQDNFCHSKFNHLVIQNIMWIMTNVLESTTWWKCLNHHDGYVASLVSMMDFIFFNCILDA